MDQSTPFSADHDLLVQTCTLQQELIKKIDEYIKNSNESAKQTASVIGELSRSQIKQDGDIAMIKGMYSSLDERLDAQESKSFRMDIASYALTTIAGIVVWIKQ